MKDSVSVAWLLDLLSLLDTLLELFSMWVEDTWNEVVRGK